MPNPIDVWKSMRADTEQREAIRKAVLSALETAPMSTGELTDMVREDVKDLDSGNLWTVLAQLQGEKKVTQSWEADVETDIQFRMWRLA